MPQTPTAQFDVQGARKAGYSDDEILQHLTQSRGFDIQGAVKSGYSKQEIIDHLSAQSSAAHPTEAQQVSTGLPQPPTGVVGSQPKAAATMQPNNVGTIATGPPLMSMQPGLPSPAQVPENATRMSQGAMIGAPAGGLIAGGAAALPAIGRGLVGAGAGAYGGGKAGKYLGQLTGIPALEPIGATLGGLTVGGLAAGGTKVPTSLGELADTFMGTGKGKPAATASAMPSEATSTASVPKNMTELPPPSTTSTTSSARVSAKGLTPPPPQATYVQKFGAPEKGIIVDPNSPPPPINKTLTSYNDEQLLAMAKKGDLDAIHELVRNPRGINLREALPNVKFLMEPGRSTRIYGGPGSTKTLLPAVGIVGAEFNKLGLADPVNPRQQTTLETMMHGPKWKDFDRSEKIEAVRDILGRK